jgi:hypothetical protein
MILGGLLEGPGSGALLVAQPAIEVGPVFLLQVPADECRVGDALAVVIDVGQIALGALEKPLLSTW